jgi:hypothetical protein
MVMPIEHIPDWEQRLARQDAFWAREIIDRPVVDIRIGKPSPDYPWPQEKEYPTLRDRWMDAERAAELALASAMNTEHLGDALPHAYPNLGPEVFSAFFGCELEFGEETSWSIPILEDWSQADRIQFSQDNVYWRKIIEITDAMLELGEGRFYTGITDMHPGGDAIAAFRDPARLNIDMVESPEQVKALLRRVTDTYLWVYDFFHEKLRSAGQAICTWAGIVSSRKWLVPSNDFSCMISPRMFQEIFLPSIAEECRHYEASLYHLDGPGALKHLEALLDIKELSAIQWVYGAGRGRSSDWLPVYRRCQAAGKGLQLHLDLDEIDLFMENLRPEGLWIGVNGVADREQAEAVLKKIARWR